MTTQSTQELRPCPFCGIKNPVIWKLPTTHFWGVKCANGCSAMIDGYTTKEAALNAWNQRPTSEVEAVTTSPADYLSNLSVKIISYRSRNRFGASLDHVGLYLLLEAAELIEALRGKGDPVKEAADHFLVLLALLAYRRVEVADVLRELERKLETEKE